MRELQLKFINNAVTVRWLRILNIIEREESFTIGRLSEVLNVSNRTLISDIGLLKKHFETSALFTFVGNRYRFVETNRRRYQVQKQELVGNEPLFDIMGSIFYGELETLTEAAERFNYSESTLRRFLQLAQRVLADYDLQLKYNPITIVGNEQNIRRFFFDFYYEGDETVHTLHPPEDFSEKLGKKISENILDYELGTGLTITGFYYILYITMERSHQGHKIVLPENLKKVVSRENDFRLLFLFQSFIRDNYGILLTKEEFIWIHLQILTRRTLDHAALELRFYERFCLWPQLDSVVANFFIHNQMGHEMEKILSPFVKSFFLTRKLNDSISPVLNKMMEEEKQVVVNMSAKQLLKHTQFLSKENLYLELSDEYLDDVAIGLTLYIQILERYYAPRKKVLCLIEGEYYVVQYIRTQIKHLLSNRHIVEFAKIKYLNEDYLKNSDIDLLITNYSVYVSDFNLIKNYILLKKIPDKKDWEHVLNKLNDLDELF